MSIVDTFLGNDAADAATKAAADTYAKQQAASAELKNAGSGYAANYADLSKSYDPYVTAGNDATVRLMAGLGLDGGEGSQAFTDAYHALPGYQSALDTGTNAALRGANAGGMLASGKTLKTLQRFGSDYEDTKSGSYLDRLSALSGTGLTATGAKVGTVGTGLTGELGARTTAYGGDMTSSGTIGQGDVAAAQAKSTALTNLLSSATYLGGAALGGGFKLPAAGGSGPVMAPSPNGPNTYAPMYRA